MMARRRALVSDADRIEAARLAGEVLAAVLDTATERGGPFTYSDSVGGVVTYWPERDPMRSNVARESRVYSPPPASRVSAGGGPSFAELDHRFRRRDWRTGRVIV